MDCSMPGFPAQHKLLWKQLFLTSKLSLPLTLSVRARKRQGWAKNSLSTGNNSKVKVLSRVQLFATPRTVAYQAPLSMGFFQARVLEWVAISFSRGSSRPRDRTWVSSIADRRFTVWATRKAHAGNSGNNENEADWSWRDSGYFSCRSHFHNMRVSSL